MRIVYMRFLCLLLLLTGLFTGGLQAQTKQNPSKENNALLWQISGNGLKKTSYIFGTYHLLTNRFLDSLPVIGQKFDASEVLISEVIFDSAAMAKMTEASVLNNTTLDKLLSPQDYKLLDAELLKLIGVGAEPFNNYNPTTVNLLMFQFVQQKYMPVPNDGLRETGMDLYLQNQAARKGKQIMALETVDAQMDALYGQFTLKRQAEMLMEYVKNIDKNKDELLGSVTCYKNQDMVCLTKMLYDSTYKPEEIDKLLYSRNRNWLKLLPSVMAKNSCFIAVGAGHLPDKDGLLEGLKKAGYTVTPVKLK